MRPVRLTFVLLGAAWLGIILRAFTISFDPARELWLAPASGWTAVVLLLLALSVSPATAIARSLGRPIPRANAWRRALGLAAAVAAVGHAAYVMTTALVISASHLITEPHLRAGATALLLLTILFATSFARATQELRRWRALHRLSYVALALAVLHVFLSPHASPTAAIAVGATALLLLSLRVLGFWPAKAERSPRG